MSSTTPQPQPFDLSYAFNEAVNNNPHLLNSPGLAADAMRSPNPQTSAQVLTHAATMSGMQQAAQDYAAENPQPISWWDHVLHGVAGPLSALGKPLEEVQRDYRYIHSLYAKHGIFVGVMGTLAVAGGAVLGAFAGGTVGAALGADLFATGLRKIGGHMSQFQDSYADSENPNYEVSAGRDFANLVGLHNQKTGAGKYVSGTVDAAFDITLDPLMKLGAARNVVRGGKYVAENERFVPYLLRGARAQDFLARNGLKIYSPDQVEALYQAGTSGNVADRLFGASRQYVRALDDISKMSSGDIIAKFPDTYAPLASDIAKATEGLSGEEARRAVHNVFIESLGEGELASKFALTGAPYVPSRTVVRSALSKFSDKLRQPGWDKLDDSAFEYRNAANFIVPRRGGEDQKWILPLALQWNRKTYYSALAKKVRTFSGRQPYNIDNKLLNISSHDFNPTDPGANRIIYDVMRFSMGERSARRIAGAFADAPDIATKRSIYLSGLHEMFKAAGLPNDSHLVSEMLKSIAKVGEGTIGSQTYGHGLELGDEVSVVHGLDGSSANALETHQIGRWSVPDFRQVKLAMRSMGQVGKLYGTVDDFTEKAWTNSVFKPLALLTTGFGLRIAASELIPTMIRYGGIDTAKAMVKNAAAKMNYKLAKGEEDHLLAHAAMVTAGNHSDYTRVADYVGDVAKGATPKTAVQTLTIPFRKASANLLSKVVDPEDYDLAARIAMATDGHIGTGATMSGHGINTDFQEQAKQMLDLTTQRMTRGLRVKPNGKFASYTVHDDHFDPMWTTSLQKESQNIVGQSIAKDVLDNLSAGMSENDAWALARKQEEARIRGVEYDSSKPGGIGKELPTGDDIYRHERKVLARYKIQDPGEFAYHRVDNLRNMFTGADGTFHKHLAEMIANGEKPTLSDTTIIDSASKPKALSGAELEPYKLSAFNNIIQMGFSKFIDPIVNNLSRQPLFFQHVKEAMPMYQNMVDRGVLDNQTALRLAMTRATKAMVPQIHNVYLRSQFSILARNYLPFYFAQEQATKRYIKLMADRPEAFRAYQLIEHALSDPGVVQTDDQGNRYLVIPGIGEIGAGALSFAAAHGAPLVGALPVTVRGNMESLKTVLPEAQMPGVSPFVAFTLNSFASLNPQFAREVKAIVGDRAFGQGVIDEAIPSAPLRNAVKALIRNEGESQYHNAMLSAIAAANYHGQLPGPDASPLEKHAFLDRIKNNATSILMIKAIVSAFSPLSPQVSQEDLGLRDEFYKMVQDKGDYGAALHEFLGKHGDNAISYTVARTEGTIPGANMPYTNEVADWLSSNKDLINSKYGEGAAFLIPQNPSGAGDKQAIYDEILKMNLRQSRHPDEFMNAIYTAIGNNQYFPDKKAHDDAVARFQALGDKASVDAENNNWKEYLADFKRANPAWDDSFSSQERKNLANRVVNQLQYIFSNNLAPNNEQSNLVRELLNDYQIHVNTLNELRYSNDNRYTLTDESDNWQKYLDTVVENEPRLQTIVNGVFRRLE